jgi:hypothetical protein
MREMVENNDDEHKEIICELRRVLVDQYRENSQSRTIIFVSRRELTIQLKAYLNEFPVVDGVRVENLTSLLFVLAVDDSSANRKAKK